MLILCIYDRKIIGDNVDSRGIKDIDSEGLRLPMSAIACLTYTTSPLQWYFENKSQVPIRDLNLTF